MKLKNIVSYLVYGLLYIISLLPYIILFAIGKFIFFIGWRIIGYRKSVIIQNLSKSFPEKKYKEIDQLATKNAEWLFRLFPQWIKMLSERKSRVKARIRFKSLDLVETDGNVFVILGHYGNWECLNVLPLFIHRPVYAVYKEQTSQVADFISNKMRTRFGLHLLESKESARFVLKNKVPSVYIFISDQAHSTHKPGFLFMNQPTSAFEGVERLAAVTNGQVVYAEINPLSNRRYNVVFKAIKEPEKATRVFFQDLENTINTAPEYWLWSHKRWKHKVSLINQ